MLEFSIIIVSYNTKDILKKCLISIFQEKLVKNGGSEVIVIDNASIDQSASVVKKEFPKVKLIINEKNLGFAKAVNQGIRAARGRNILLLNSDTIVQEGTLEKLLRFEDETRPSIIGLKMLNTDKTAQGSVFNFPTIKRAIEEFWFGRKGAFSKFVPSENVSIEVEAISGGAMLIPREIIEKIGLFDERYFMYFEDLDYCRRARKAGFKIYYLPSAKVIHEHGASGKHLATKKDQWRRLIPSSKIYHGLLRHYLINMIIWSGQKWRGLLKK